MSAVIPERCPACSARTQPSVAWCPQCYLDLRPAPESEPESEPQPTLVAPRHRATEPGDEAPSALSAVLSAEDEEAKAQADALAEEMLAKLAAEHAASSDLKAVSKAQEVKIMIGGTVVLLTAVLALMFLLGMFID